MMKSHFLAGAIIGKILEIRLKMVILLTDVPKV